MRTIARLSLRLGGCSNARFAFGGALGTIGAEFTPADPLAGLAFAAVVAIPVEVIPCLLRSCLAHRAPTFFGRPPSLPFSLLASALRVDRNEPRATAWGLRNEPQSQSKHIPVPAEAWSIGACPQAQGVLLMASLRSAFR